MSQRAAHKNFLQTSDAMYLAALASAILLDVLYPLSLKAFVPKTPLYVFGGAFTLIGAGLVIWTKRTMSYAKQPTKPGEPTTKLVTGGPFAISRNPIYLGGTVSCLGVAFLFDLPWFLPLMIAATLFTMVFLVLPEERYLEALFGEEYRSYKESVRRWL